MFSQFASLFGIGLGLVIIIFVVLVAILVFEIMMFVSALLNKRISDTRKLLWVFGMILIHPFVAIGYYFIDYKKA